MTLALEIMEPTGRNVEFSAVMERIAAGRSSRELNRLTIEAGLTVSHSTIADARWGTPPKLPLLKRLLDALHVSDQDRADAMRTAYGYAYREAQAVADELNTTRTQLVEAERILAEIVEVQQLHQARNPGAPPLDVDFFRDPALPFAEKIRLFTVLKERISRGELDFDAS